MSSQPTDLETQFTRLKSIVETLEDGELSLEDSIKAFEEGVQLTKAAQEILSSAEQKVQLLLGDGEQPDTEDFGEETD